MVGLRSVRGHRPDYVLAIGVFVLLAIGMIMIYSISPELSHNLVGSSNPNYYFYNQLKYVALGLAVWIFASSVNYQIWRKYASWLLLASGFAMLLLLTPFGNSSHGATRWVDIGILSFQPAELVKVSLILYLAAWFDKRGEEIKSFWDSVVPFAVVVGIISFIIVILQKDMGTMLVVAGTAVGMYVAAGLRWSHFGVLAGGGILASIAAVIAQPHRLGRLTTFLNPTQDPLGTGYHINQALIAIGSGGIIGLGLGKSQQVYGYLPEAANDSIFAVIAEEFGFIGSVIILGLFLLLVYRGLQIARNAPDTFARLTAVGITLWFCFQSLINIGAMLSVVPLTGIPLPFISYGGTSLILSLFGAGVLLNISKFTTNEVAHAYSSERRGDSRPHFANSGNGRRVKVAR